MFCRHNLSGLIDQGCFKEKAMQADQKVKGLDQAGYARMARKVYVIFENERCIYYGLVSQHAISIFNAISTQVTT
jgi:hypothetical protein